MFLTYFVVLTMVFGGVLMVLLRFKEIFEYFQWCSSVFLRFSTGFGAFLMVSWWLLNFFARF